jgi:hypothetical protein
VFIDKRFKNRGKPIHKKGTSRAVARIFLDFSNHKTNNIITHILTNTVQWKLTEVGRQDNYKHCQLQISKDLPLGFEKNQKGRWSLTQWQTTKVPVFLHSLFQEVEFFVQHRK